MFFVKTVPAAVPFGRVAGVCCVWHIRETGKYMTGMAGKKQALAEENQGRNFPGFLQGKGAFTKNRENRIARETKTGSQGFVLAFFHAGK